MKNYKNLLLPVFLLLTTACGKNAFLENKAFNSTQAVTESRPDEDIRFYYGDAASALDGYKTSLFQSELSSRSESYVEDFSSLCSCKPMEVTNKIGDITYKITHIDDSKVQTRRPIHVESPVNQRGAYGDGKGLDFAYGSSKNKNTMLISFDKPVAHFGIDLIDFETSTNFTLGQIIARGCSSNQEIIAESSIDFGTEDGYGEVHFFGFISKRANICSIHVLVGDDSIGDGKREKFAVDNLRFGSATLR